MPSETPAPVPAPHQPKKKTFNLPILSVIKNCQNQNGLRHKDYQRYRQYCSRRLARLRKGVHFTHNGKRFNRKEIKPETVHDVRYLHIPLMKAERAWSYAMELKEEAAEGEAEARKKHHTRRRLKKAVKHSSELKHLCEHRADNETSLEAEAYCLWMTGNLLLETEQWDEALENFIRARKIYSELPQIVHDLERRQLFENKVEEIEPSIRWCSFNKSTANKGKVPITTGTEIDFQELERQIGKDNPSLDLLKTKLEDAKTESRKNQTNEISEVVWKGKILPLKSEKVKLSLLAAQENVAEMEKTTNVDKKFALYDKVLLSFGEAYSAAKELGNTGKKSKTGKDSNQKEIIEGLVEYISHEKLRWSLQRIQETIASLEAKIEAAATAAPDEKPKKLPKPDELSRLYDNLIQTLNEIESLLGGTDPSASQIHNAQILSAKIFRSYYLARGYLGNFKWPEALALIERAHQQIPITIQHHKSNKTLNASLSQSEIQKLEKLDKVIESERFMIHARAFTATLQKTNTPATAEKTDKNLVDVIEEYDTKPASKNRLVAFPPDFETIGCRPLLFDLALLEVNPPSLDGRKEQKRGWFGIF